MIKSLRIVIVEDDAIIAMDLEELLNGMDHDVRAIAHSEAEAVAAALRCEPDLMIVDARLAEGSGVSAMAQILQRCFVPHLYITGDPQRILQCAPDAVVVAKPFNLQALVNGIRLALSEANRPAHRQTRPIV